MIKYDKRGNCERCGLPGSGFISDGVCMCLDDAYPPNHTINCTCKQCEDAWEEVEASRYSRHDSGYDRN